MGLPKDYGKKKIGDPEQPPKEFLEQINEWMVNPDGNPLCPSCWHAYITNFETQLRKTVRKDSRPLKDIASSYKARDGYFVPCSGKECTKNVSTSFA